MAYWSGWPRAHQETRGRLNTLITSALFQEVKYTERTDFNESCSHLALAHSPRTAVSHWCAGGYAAVGWLSEFLKKKNLDEDEKGEGEDESDERWLEESVKRFADRVTSKMPYLGLSVHLQTFHPAVFECVCCWRRVSF